MGHAKEQWMRQQGLGWTPGSNNYVCAKCIDDYALADVIKANVDSPKCSFCGKRSKHPIAAPVDTVTEHMAICLNEEFTDPVNELPYESREGGYQGTVLDAWELLDEIGFEVSSDELMDEIRSAFDGQDWCRKDYFAMSPEERKLFGWERFKRAVKHERRFTFWSMGDDENEDYHPDHLPVGKMLAEIAASIRSAKQFKTLRIGTPIWRVRVHPTKSPFSHDYELGSPPNEKANQSNRMSPAGVAMFYGAEDFDTACAETVDPNRGADKSVTGVCFRTARPMRVLDLFELPGLPSFFDLEGADLRHNLSFLYDFAADLAKPIQRDDSEHVEYAPTQAFTEYVRFEMKTKDGKPVDGIRFRSSRNRRACYVLFCDHEDCVEEVEYRRRERQLLFAAETLRTEEVVKLRFLGTEKGNP